MKITKLGHCCLLIETKGKRIVTDPGSYTIDAHSNLENLDYCLFTHDHSDHYHVESLKLLLEKNSKMKIYANNSVGALLAQEGIEHVQVNHQDQISLGDISLLGVGEYHAIMHSSIEAAANLGFFIDEKLWYPGDAFTNPERPVEILALPVSGPWMKISEAVDYALLLKPKIAFPVHDGLRFGAAHAIPLKVLPQNNIVFKPLVEGESFEC